MHIPTDDEWEIVDQIAANLQRIELAAAAIGQAQLATLIDVALLEALDLLNAPRPKIQIAEADSHLPHHDGQGREVGDLTRIGIGLAEVSAVREGRVRRLAKRQGQDAAERTRKPPAIPRKGDLRS